MQLLVAAFTITQTCVVAAVNARGVTASICVLLT
jgi:hypothetical protein